MAGELYNYLPVVTTATYTASRLVAIPHEVLPVRAGYTQKKIVYDDLNTTVNTFGARARIIVELKFKLMDASEVGPIFDFYMDPLKAWGMQNTFFWDSPPVWPTMEYTYLARFWNEEIETLFRTQADITSLLLSLEGYVVPTP